MTADPFGFEAGEFGDPVNGFPKKGDWHWAIYRRWAAVLATSSKLEAFRDYGSPKGESLNLIIG